MSDEVVYGTPIPWYRINGWITQSGGTDWMRYQLHVLSLVLIQTPWILIAPLTKPLDDIESPPD